MKRKHLLFTLLLALVVPLAALAQVERTVTVYNGNDMNAHVPVDGGHGTIVPAKNQFIMDKAELNDLAGKQITKMAFHVVDPNITMKTGDHLPYSVLLAEVDYTDFGNAGLLTNNLTNAVTVASGVQLELTGNMLVITFSRAYTYSGNNNLLVQFSCSSATNYFTPFFESYELRFFGVNMSRAGIADLGMGIYRHYGFVPKTTFTYLDEATWANTNCPQNLITSADQDGDRLTLSWDAGQYTGSTYQTLCVLHGQSPNWSNAETVMNQTTNLFYDLDPNTTYDLYVRAKYPSLPFYSAPAKVIAMTKHIANLDNGNLVIDFDGAFVPNGVVATGNYSNMLDITRFWYTDSGYGSYNMHSPSGTVRLPSLAYQDANNGVIMEFDLTNASDLQVQFCRQGLTTNLGTFSANSWTHYSVRVIEGTGAQNAYFQFVSTNDFNIDNILIYKAPTTMKPYNLQASDIMTNSATITWDDYNTSTVTHYMRYKKTTDTEWQYLNSSVTSPYVLTGNTSNPLETYTQYEVQLMAQRSSTDYCDWTESFVFATACPTTQTKYTQYFTNLSDLPSYWRVAKGEGVNYSVSSGYLAVSNTSYQVTSYGSTYTAYTTLDAYVIMPYFENLSSLQLSFKAGRTAGSYNELVVGVMSDPFDVTSFSTLEPRILNGPTTTYNFSLANAEYTHGHIAIRLNHYEDNNQSVWFDDFVVTRFDEPTELTVSNVTNTSATLAWTSQANEFEVRYKTTSASAWTSVSPNPTSNTCTISNLTNNTEYEAQIRAKNVQNQYSPWASFGTFKTLRQEAVVMNAMYNSYYEDFESSDGGWMFLNSSTNKWRRFSYSKNGYNYGYGLRVTNSEDNVLNPSWTYQTRSSYTMMGQTQYLATPAVSFAVKTFTLSEGHYEFSYRRAVKGVADEDYMRVVLVPAETELVAGTMPDGFDYQSTPAGWFSLDYGEQLSGNPLNDYQWIGISTISLNVYSGSTYEPGNYMIVVLWKNEGTTRRDGENPPGAIDNVSVAWSSLIDPPTNISAVESDTQADMAWTVPSSGFTPTGYQVQYEPLGNNGFEGAPIAETSTNYITLTDLTPHTNYQVRVRSAYTTGGNTIYSDWTTPVAFTTLYPRPTNLTLVDQTSSWASVMWDEVELEVEEGEYLRYSYQLTTDPDNWGNTHDGVASNGWDLNFAPGTYYFRVQTDFRDSDNASFRSPWSEPISFTIAPWADPVTVFPLTYGFEGSHFDDGITLGGNSFDHFSTKRYSTTGLPFHDGGESAYVLSFGSGYTGEALLVLPPLRPSTNDALVSFWWYHDSSNNEVNDGVIVEYSADGSSWSSFGTMTTRYAAESGWVKYSFVVPAPTSSEKVYVRLHFYGANTTEWWRCCYLDDLTVNAFQSQQPYIYDVLCDGSTADIMLYDYAYDNGWPSSAFQVQYREYSETAGAEEGWTTYPYFTNAEPHTFINHLTVTGLQPTTLYEFRACARVSYGGFDFTWSNYCEPYRMWTSCGTHTITNSHSFTESFEDEFYWGCWTGDIDDVTGWHLNNASSHGGTKSLFNTTKDKEILTPEIDLTNLSASTDNVVLRFWANSNTLRCRLKVYVGSDEGVKLYDLPKTNNAWRQIELSLSSFMGNVIRIGFIHEMAGDCYIDDMEIIANPYPDVKIFDAGTETNGLWSNDQYWYPGSVPTINDDVRILGGEARVQNGSANAKSIVVGANGQIRVWVGTLNVAESFFSDFAKINSNNNGVTGCPLRVTSNSVVNIQDVTVVDANSIVINGASSDGILNITGTLTPGEANSVIVRESGVLNAATVNNSSQSDAVLIKDGGQMKSDNPFQATIEKSITGYGAENITGRAGWYLFATPTKVFANPVLVPMNNHDYLFEQMDLYRYDQSAALEWINFKCSEEGGCPGPNNTTYAQGTIVGAQLLEPQKGYLYARQNDATLSIAAGGYGEYWCEECGLDGAYVTLDQRFIATSTDVSVNYLAYDPNAVFPGWNLIGNPFICNAYLKNGGNYITYYKMNDTGDQIILANADEPIKPCEGVFVQCTNNPATRMVTFTSTVPSSKDNAMNFKVSKSDNSMGSACVVDRAIIRFGEGENVGHLDIMASSNRLYIPMKGKDMSVVFAQPFGEMPVNFEAAKNGTYTLSVNIDDAELLYCHLIDNKTSADVNLLEMPEYTFNAKVDDNASRFKVVFVTASEDADDDSEIFAFNSNGNWIIANEGCATLQVIDLNDRVLSSQQIDGCGEIRINAAPGLYMIRLINGENVKVQKVVVR